MRSKLLCRSLLLSAISMMACVPAAADNMNLFAVKDAELTGAGGAQNNAAASSNWGGLTYLVGNVNKAGGPTSTCPAPAGQVCFNGGPGEARGLLWFDLSVLPQYSVIDSATISLYVGFNAFSPIASRINSVSLFNVTSDWTEMGVTYNSRPTWDTTPVTSLSIPAATGSIQNPQPYNGYINGSGNLLTSLVQEWYNDPTLNDGLITSDTANNNGLLRIYAHEAGGTDASIDPRLSVTYHIEAPAPVPEPSSVFLLSGAGVITFLAVRKRRPQTRG